MRSTKLRLDDVQVESFQTGSGVEEQGTVHAHEEFFGTRLVKCGTNNGPYCDTQKLTGPCGSC